MKLTRQDVERIDELHDQIDDLIAGEKTYVCLNALCSVLGGYYALQASEDAVTKQRFISDVVECIDVWQDHYSEQMWGKS